MDTILTLIGTCIGSMITGMFALTIAILDKKQRKEDSINMINLERRKSFTDAQRSKALYLCEQIEMFRQLEEKYIEEVVALRTQLNILPNKFGSVKVEMREKINNDEKRLNYKLSDYLYLKNFFEESQSILEHDKIEIKDLDRLDKEGKK